jgi:hypothetical protein
MEQAPMHEHVKLALKNAILASLPIVRDEIGNHPEAFQVWRKAGKNEWQFVFEDRANFRKVLNAVRNRLTEVATEFANLFRKEYPEYCEMVGLAGFGQQRICSTDSQIVESALGLLWYRHSTLRFDDDSVGGIVDEFEKFVDQPNVRLNFQAQLLNFRMDSERLDLPENLVVRRLNDEEISAIYGGPAATLGFITPRHIFGPQEFVIEGEVEVAKQVGSSYGYAPSALEIVRTRLGKAILSLRTFKVGCVGYERARFVPVMFCPVAIGHGVGGDGYVPVGSYDISKEEELPLCEHAAAIFDVTEPKMLLACSRLADAEIRTRPEDQLMDAVIGMEALLIPGGPSAELKLRFSLHYSTLFDTPEQRYRSYLVAKDLYDLRSTIAHGSKLKGDRCRVGKEKITLADAATRATHALRTIIRRFLSEVKAAPYTKTDFWEPAYFGMGRGAVKPSAS